MKRVKRVNFQIDRIEIKKNNEDLFIYIFMKNDTYVKYFIKEELRDLLLYFIMEVAKR